MPLTFTSGNTLTFTLGSSGAKGDTGAPGTALSLIELEAGENIGTYKVVYSTGGLAYLADNSTSSHLGKIVGVTTESELSGEDITIQAYGPLEDATWTWSDGPIYLGSNGALTQTAPTSGFVLEVGRALTLIKFLVNPKIPFIFV